MAELPELTPEQQNEIRKAVAIGAIDVWNELADKYRAYGMTPAAIDAMARGRAWRHLRKSPAPSPQLELF
jgi:hypothetical protein